MAAETENQIVVYQPNETVRLDVRLENETVWLTQDQMSMLFGRDQSVIARHIGNIFKEGELDKKVVYAKFAYTTRQGGSRCDSGDCGHPFRGIRCTRYICRGSWTGSYVGQAPQCGKRRHD